MVASSAGLSSTHISRNRKMEDFGKLTGFPSPSKKQNSFTAIIQMMFLLRSFLFTKKTKKQNTNLQEHLAHRCRNPSNFSCFAKLLLEPSILVKRVVAINFFFFPTQRKCYFTQHFTHPGNHSQVFKSGFLFPTLVTSTLGPLPSFGLCDFRYLSLQGQTLPRAFWFQAENKNRCTSKMIQAEQCFWLLFIPSTVKKKKILPFERITWIPWEAWKHVKQIPGITRARCVCE